MSWVQQPQRYPTWGAMPAGPTVGSWPASAPAPFSGPPPVPAGVDPRVWSSGQWAYNPMYRGPVMPPQGAYQAWAPHPSWGPAVANASYNPFKRVPNPGSAEYWSTKLLDNPLGLENMDIKDDTPMEERRKKDTPDGVPHTPWVWIPKELRESSESSIPPSAPDDPSGSSRPTHTPPDRTGQPAQSRPESFESTRQAPTSRSTYPGSVPDYAPASRDIRRRADSDARRAQAELQNATSVSASTYAAQQQQQQHQQPAQMARSATQPYQTEQPRPPGRDISPRHVHSSSEQRDASPREHGASAPANDGSAVNGRAPTSGADDSPKEGFSSRVELHPTFSTGIIRTPSHYTSGSVSTPPRRASHDDFTPSRVPISPYAPSHHSTSTANTPRRTSHDDTDRYGSGNHSPVSPRTPHTPSYSTSSSRHSTPQRSPLRPTPDEGGHASSRTQTSPNSSGQSMTTSAMPRRTNSEPDRGASRSQSVYLNGHTYDTAVSPTRSNSLPTRHSSAPTRSSTTSSLSSNVPFSSNLSEEPEGLLSPLVGFPRPAEPVNSIPLGRHHTYPSITSGTIFEPIPEDRVAPQHRTQRTEEKESNVHEVPPVIPDARPSHRYSEPPDNGRRISRSQTYPTVDPGATPRASAPPSASRERSPTFRHNPLPLPPKLSTYSDPTSVSSSSTYSCSPSHPSSTYPTSTSSHHHPSTYSSSTSQPQQTSYSSSTAQPHQTSYPSASQPHLTSYSSTAPQPPAPSTSGSSASSYTQRVSPNGGAYPRRTVRKGFWNRRGDHLVIEQGRQYIVYAPHKMANPADLADYPRPTEGFKDHDGNRLKYNPSAEELPDSLPRHGEPPRRPYEHFVQYVYL